MIVFTNKIQNTKRKNIKVKKIFWRNSNCLLTIFHNICQIKTLQKLRKVKYDLLKIGTSLPLQSLTSYVNRRVNTCFPRAVLESGYLFRIFSRTSFRKSVTDCRNKWTKKYYRDVGRHLWKRCWYLIVTFYADLTGCLRSLLQKFWQGSFMINLTFEKCQFYGSVLTQGHEPGLEMVNHTIL